MNALNEVDWANIALKAGIALAILIVTWILAKIVSSAIVKLTSKVKFLQQAGADGENMGVSLGTIASLLIWLFGLIAILQVFGLDQVLTPVQSLLDSVLSFLPSLVAAGFVFVVGALLAKIVRQLIETALATVPFEKWFNSATKRVGTATGTSSGYSSYSSSGASEVTADSPAQGSPFAALPKTLATIVYALIMIVVAIAALQIVGIESVSRPAEQMLNTIFNAIPNIIAALIILGIGIMIARFAGDILQQVLDGFGTDRALSELGALPQGRSATPIIAKVIQIAITLFFAVMATQMLGFPQITLFLSEILELGGKVLFGAAIITIGFFIANLLADMLSGTIATVARWATVVLFVAMGLSYMGIADAIIELAFGALVVGGAAAAALAFGLGGRDAAARQLERVSSKGNSSSGTSTGFTTGGSTGNNS